MSIFLIGKNDESFSYMPTARDMASKIVFKDYRSIEYKLKLASIYQMIGDVKFKSNLSAAFDNYLISKNLYVELLNSNSKNAEVLSEYLTIDNKLADILSAVGDDEKSIYVYAE